MTEKARLWKSSSVRKFSGGKNPINVVQQKARALALSAMDKGWQGPPFDPFQLADQLGYLVIPTDSVKDARLLVEGSTIRIEYNPNRNAARIRYSIAHEIAHTQKSENPEQLVVVIRDFSEERKERRKKAEKEAAAPEPIPPEKTRFGERYQSWYSRALPLMKQLAPDRIQIPGSH